VKSYDTTNTSDMYWKLFTLHLHPCEKQATYRLVKDNELGGSIIKVQGTGARAHTHTHARAHAHAHTHTHTLLKSS